MGVFEKYPVGSGVALQTRIPLHTTGHKRCFWIPRMGLFERHHAKKHCVGSGVALQTPTPLHATGQKSCFWIPRMGVFELHNARKYSSGVLGWRPKHPYYCTPWARNCVFGSLEWVSLDCSMPENIVWVPGWRPNNPYHCTPWARNCVFGSLEWVSLKHTMPQKNLRVLCWRPEHPYLCTPWARNCVFGPLGWVSLNCTMPKKNCMGSGVAPQPPIPLHTMGQKRCFWIPRVGVFETHKNTFAGRWGTVV